MRIDQETIERIQQTADIVEVVSDFVSLKKRGSNMIACCPFHNEKTPSFSVSPAKGIYKCFGCGKAGDSIRFVMDVEGIGYLESLKYLAKKYGIEIEEREMTSQEEVAQNERDSLYIALNYAKTFYQQALFHSDEGKSIGLSYFKERGFNEKTIRDFELGYSHESWDAFTKDALAKGYNQTILEKAGLTIRKEPDAKQANERLFDRFRARVIFPIHNVAGKVIAFGARILKADKNQPKYLNSPETEVYHKSQILYGIFQAKQSIRQEDVCYLVEGYTDVISLYQAGIQNVVASSGTSLTHGQIQLISRFTQNITVLYDGDAAGVKASLRGTDLILEEGLNVKVVVFPDNEDPDSYVKRIGAEAFKTFIRENSNDFITFKTKLFLKEAGNDPFKRAEIIKEVVNSISKIPDSIKRAVFFRQTASLMEMDEATLIAESNKLYLQNRQQKEKEHKQTLQQEKRLADLPLTPESVDEIDFLPQPPVKTQRSPLSYQEEETVRLLITYPNHLLDEENTLCQYILAESEEIEFQTPIYREIMAIFREELGKGNVLTTDFFIRHLNARIQHEAVSLIAPKHQLNDWKGKHGILVPMEEDNLPEVAYTNMLRLKRANVEQMIADNMQQIAKTMDNPEEQNRLMRTHMKLKEVEKEIAKQFGNVTSRL